jgi:hypothetical protein
MGFGLLYIIYIDDQLMEKWIDFVKIKFHLNENIEWYYMQFDLKFYSLQLRFNSIQFNSIQISVAYAPGDILYKI